MTLDNEWDKESVNFPLTRESVVFEIGGYVGRWAKEISERYDPYLYVFEPQTWAYIRLEQALIGYPKAQIFNFALGVTEGTFPMNQWETDGCSFVHSQPGKMTGEGKMLRMGKFLRDSEVDHIDLCLMNIEGYEFTLIPYMIRNRIFDRIHYFMCEFHPSNDFEQKLYWRLRDWFGTHGWLVRFNYGPTLTCWEKF
jgi:FkbM family methyltransferase